MIKKESEVLMICSICKNPIEGIHDDEREEFMVDGKPVHEDCWFEEMGKLVEEHPVVSGRRGRGCAAN